MTQRLYYKSQGPRVKIFLFSFGTCTEWFFPLILSFPDRFHNDAVTRRSRDRAYSLNWPGNVCASHLTLLTEIML